MRTPNHNNFGLVRLVLATLVVFGHFKTLAGPGEAYGIFAYADFAVNAFFVVSGYLVFASYDKKPMTGSFYIRRIFRIYPLYMTTVIVQGLAMAWLAGGIFSHLGDLLHYLAFNLPMANFLAHDLGGVLSHLYNPGINPSLWTLKIEVAFYFVLPLLWYFTRRWKAAFLILLYLASTAYVAVALHYGEVVLAKQLPGQLRYFAVGIALYRYRDRLTFSLPAAIAGALLLFGLCALRHDLPLLLVYPVCVGLLVFICALRLPAWPLKFDISYGVYLFHGPLIQFALLCGYYEDTALFLLLMLAAVYGAAFLAERLIEQPGIELGKRLARAWEKRYPAVEAEQTA